MIGIIYAISIILGFLCKKSRLVTALMIAVMIVVAGFSTDNADHLIYQSEYLAAGADNWIGGTRYLGYYVLQRAFIELGFEFSQFLPVILGLSFCILFLGLFLITDNVNFALSCYMIYSFPMDAVQIRTCLANSIAVLALALFFRGSQRGHFKEKAEFRITVLPPLFLLLIAATIHILAIFPLLCLVLYAFVGRNKHYNKIISIITIVFSAIVLSGIVPWLLQLLESLGVMRAADSLSRWGVINTRLGWLIPVGCLFLAELFILFDKNLTKDILTAEIAKFSHLAIMLIPLFILDVTYIRIFRVFMVLIYAAGSRRFAPTGSNRIELNTILNTAILFLSIISLFYVEVYPSYSGTLGSLLMHNSLIN